MKWTSWLSRWIPYLGRRRAEEGLQTELGLHLALERERRREAGLPDDAALNAAKRTLGNPLLIREHTRDVWSWSWLDDLGRDLRHVLRGVQRSPGFSATVALILALGIGATTAMFSIVHGVLLRPLPYPDAGAIMRVGDSFGPRSLSAMLLSNRSMPLLQELSQSFEQLAAFEEISAEWDSSAGVSLHGARVSPSLFPLLRAAPQLGRLFLEEEARTGAERVVLLSHGAWTRRFASDSAVVGTTIDLDGDPHLIVGVLAEGFAFPGPDSEFWTPFVIPPFTQTTMQRAPGQRTVFRNEVMFSALGRLRPDVSAEQAATEARAILQRSGDGFPVLAGTTGERDVRVTPLLEEMVGEYRPALSLLTAVTVLVLLVACLNAAGLLLARGVTRQRMLAVSAALGASRSRLVRQLVTESTVLSLLGGVLGLAVATVVVGAAPALVPVEVVRLDEVRIDGVVFTFTLGLSLLVGLLCGVGPAFQRALDHLARALHEGSARSAGGFRLLRSHRVRATLATVQVALALVLLIGAGLLLRSFVQVLTFDRGFDPANVVATRIRNPMLSQRPATPEGILERRASHLRFQNRLLDEMTTRLTPLPDVDAFGLSWSVPFVGRLASRAPLRLAGTPVPSDPNEMVEAELQIVSPGYFETMRFRLRDGRTISRLDGPESPRVLVANETLARELFAGDPAVVGRRVMVGSESWEVIGVVGDVLYGGVELTAESRPEAFFPLAQVQDAINFGLGPTRITVRTTGDSLAMIPFLREAATATNPQATMDPVIAMEERLSSAVAEPRFNAFVVGSLASITLVLAGFGVYGLLSYTVAQRRGEIAIRMALGAGRRQILALVVGQGAVIVAAGTVIGIGAAFASSRMLGSLLYGIDTDDRLTFLLAPFVLVAIALFACWLPVRRATRIDPMKMLRFG
ncbi:MAG: ABC transporter permease [Acidobacteria bacterium]|nr:ABC transporter permease [Acidobacteriota bacterium]